MTRPAGPLAVVLRSSTPLHTSPSRFREPVTVGVPLPVGAAMAVDQLVLSTPDGDASPLQARGLDRWPDRSLRWVLLSFPADSATDALNLGRRSRSGDATSGVPLVTAATSDEVVVDTGEAVFTFRTGEPFPLPTATVRGTLVLDAARSGLGIDLGGRHLRFVLSAVSVIEQGPVRVEVAIEAGAAAGVPLEVFGRVEMFAGSATVRLHLTLRNGRSAVHAGGQWGLGDAGSLAMQSASIELASRGPVVAVEAALEAGQALGARQLPFSVLQESSGGARWNSQTHVTGEGRVPFRFRGYRCLEGGVETFGDRATPVVLVHSADSEFLVTLPRFWEEFPRSITVDRDRVVVGLFPAECAQRHELQGGEQKTWTVVVAFSRDTVSDPPLAWVHEPQLVCTTPEWNCATGAVPFLVPAVEDPSAAFLALVDAGLDPQRGFVAKRERFDEYGWRHFGDLPADHESAFLPEDRPLVSHYNNQYDAIAGFALQFLRTGDRRWWTLMDDLARHVRDIDIYHATDDKSAYSGGLFWHTAHYVDAGTSTHRTYPPGGASGGGPSAEHNYNIGLMLHYFLTGEEWSRTAAVGLGQWVLDMDDGRRTVFRWLSAGPTGHASFTNGYYGPGRGAGHSILACLVAHRLSGEGRFLAKAEELIRRTAHPDDDIEAHTLLNAELRWSYTVFLQALGAYLFHKLERQEVDAPFAYARCTLLHYARWMREHERPYLDRPEELEYPTETWVAQDLRKGDVFLWSALLCDPEERDGFLERAHFFFDYALTTLAAMPTRTYTRPLAVVMSHGVRRGWLLRSGDNVPGLAQGPWPACEAVMPTRRPFMPQRVAALRRARLATVAVIAAVVVLLALKLAW